MEDEKERKQKRAALRVHQQFYLRAAALGCTSGGADQRGVGRVMSQWQTSEQRKREMTAISLLQGRQCLYTSEPVSPQGVCPLGRNCRTPWRGLNTHIVTLPLDQSKSI